MTGRGCSTKDKIFHIECENHVMGRQSEKFCYCSYFLCNAAGGGRARVSHPLLLASLALLAASWASSSVVAASWASSSVVATSWASSSVVAASWVSSSSVAATSWASCSSVLYSTVGAAGLLRPLFQRHLV